MNPTQSLLCPLVFCLGSFCFALAMDGDTVTDVFTAAAGRDLTTMSHLEVKAAEVETDELWAGGGKADRSVTGTSLAGVHSQEELNSSPPEPSWSPEVHEERSLPADASSPLVTSVLVTGTGELDAFASVPQAWVSPSTETRPSDRGQGQAVPSPSPTTVSASQAAASWHGETLGGDRGEGLDAREPGTDLPAELNPSDPHAGSSPSSPPQLLPANTAATGAVATTAAGGDVVSSQGLPVTDGKEMGFSVTDPEGLYSLEATSNVEEPGSSAPTSSGTKPTTAGEEPQSTTQVICRDWSKLAGKSYVILNMTENVDCEVFRSRRGSELLGLVAGSFSRKLSTPADSWLISLSKPSEDDKHLLMMLASDRGTIPAKEVLAMLGDMKENLEEIGIHNVTSATGCQGRPSQPRGDYGKLFIVLVIIGSICAVIIVSGLVYICWQRQLPKLKNMSHGEELHFVENGCHDNPTLDITIDSTSEMQEKKPSVNGDAMECSGGWNALITKGSKGQEPDSFEEDTHL